MNKFLKEFKDRGYFYQCTNENELSDLLDKKSINAYIGFDSTAPSLHVGSLMQIMCLKLLQIQISVYYHTILQLLQILVNRFPFL